jgi:hypothetical protein
MARSRPYSDANPDLRRRCHVAAPAIDEIEQLMLSYLTPGSFKPLKSEVSQQGKRLRDRLLTLPVMVAIVLGLVYRQLPSLSDLRRLLEREGLLWVEPMKISVEALSKRLRVLPASLFRQLLVEVQERLPCHQAVSTPPWTGASEEFTACWIADGSTLEELRRTLKIERAAESTVLGGKMMAVVEAFTHQPVEILYTPDEKANDKRFDAELLERLPQNGLLIFDLGFFKFPWFDEFSEQGKFFVTRLREKTAYRSVELLSAGQCYRDEIIQMGQYRSNPCHHPVRLVSVRWSNVWYHYLTNVLDPHRLTPEQVCELYRRRWRIEDAFALTKRLLGLSYLWVADRNGVEIQIYATWIFYLLLNQLCAEVAWGLQLPLERISMEMVFRGLYHYAHAYLTGEASRVVDFFLEHHQLLGLVKNIRQRHRLREAQLKEIWDPSP